MNPHPRKEAAPDAAALVSLRTSALEPRQDGVRERSNWDVLSLLRFGLALVVALAHLEHVTHRLGWLGAAAESASFDAVLGFLFISGFSIGHSIQRKPRGFFGRRLWRIYPVYLAAMLLTYAVQREPLTGALLWNFLLNLFFLNQVFVGDSYISSAWSLSLEIWLYALAPLLIRCRAASLEVLIAASFVCYAFYTGGRSLFHWPHHTGTLYGLNLPCLGFIWLAGFYLSVASGKRRPFGWAAALFAATLAVAMGIQGVFRFKHHHLHDFWTADLGGFFWQGMPLLITFLLFLGVAAHRFHFGWRQHRLCRFLGNISYPLYLVHLVAFAACAYATRNSAAMISAALVLATLVYLGCDFYSRRRN
jgi:peptidoglycan/LPS O-acetylase OafA/YrhL